MTTTTTSAKRAAFTIRRATAADRDNVITALTTGFSNDVIISGWLFTDPATYARHAGAYFACYTDFAIEHGYVWTTGDGVGAVVAMPFNAWQQSQHDAALKDKVIQATGPYIEQAFVLDAALTERHPTSSDHLYLAFIAITPQHRGQGIGTLMLRELFDFADQLQLPIYGEASCEGNRRLYTRIGTLPMMAQPSACRALPRRSFPSGDRHPNRVPSYVQ